MSANMLGDRLMRTQEAELGQCSLEGTRYGRLNQDCTVIIIAAVHDIQNPHR